MGEVLAKKSGRGGRGCQANLPHDISDRDEPGGLSRWVRRAGHLNRSFAPFVAAITSWLGHPHALPPSLTADEAKLQIRKRLILASVP